MAELLAKIIEFLEKITIKRVIVMITLGTIIILCFPLIDYYFYFNIRTMGRIDVLEKISSLNLEVIKDDPILMAEYNRILLEIQEHSKGLSFDISGFINTETNKTVNLYKFLTGGFWGWLIIALSPLIYKKKIKDMFIPVLIFTLLGTFLGWVSMQIPTFINPLYNYIGFPVLQLAIGIVIGIMVSQKKKKGQSTSPNS